MNEKFKIIITTAIVCLILGTVIGFCIPKSRDIRFVREDCHDIYQKYMSFTNTVQDYLLPYNETDIVNITISGNHIRASHTVESAYGLKELEIGFDEGGFIRYIEEWK